MKDRTLPCRLSDLDFQVRDSHDPLLADIDSDSDFDFDFDFYPHDPAL